MESLWEGFWLEVALCVLLLCFVLGLLLLFMNGSRIINDDVTNLPVSTTKRDSDASV